MINRTLAVIEHDEKNAKNFSCYEMHELKAVFNWLDRLIKRRENRIVFFFGNQTALISLVTVFIFFLDRAGGITAVMSVLVEGLKISAFGSWITFLLLACLLGFILGTLMLKSEISRYSYWHDMIHLAIQKKEIKNAMKENIPVSTEPKPVVIPVVMRQKFSWKTRIKVFCLGKL